LFPEINVSKQDIVGVEVRLGPKGATLDGDVRDKVSQSFVQKAKITIRDAKRPEAFVEVFSDKAGHFRFTVPSKFLLISATAEGYKTAHMDEGRQWMPSSGEHRAIIFELEPN
jgi:hypothetical protein